MKICLINPQRLLELNTPTLKSTPPLGLAFIAGTLKHAGHKVTAIDALAEDPHNIFPFEDSIVVNGISYESLLNKIPPDSEVIGFHFMFSNNWLLYRKVTELVGDRFPNATLIAGGEHITSMYKLSLKQAKHLDVCVLGEGEETAEQLLLALEEKRSLDTVNGLAYRNDSGETVVTGRRVRIKNLEEIPVPAWELFPLENYNEYKMTFGVNRGNSLPITATRGCPYECTFCSNPVMWGRLYNMRTPEHVVDEIEMLQKKYNVVDIDFYDLTAIIKKDWIIEFAKEMIKRKLNVTWQLPGGTRSEAIDYEVADLLYKSGCRNIVYAPESGSPKTLSLIKKKVKIPNMLNSIRQSYKAGLNIKLNMIVGFPDETHLDIWKTNWFLIRCAWYGTQDAIPAIFSPYPGTVLYDQLKAEGKIEDDDAYFKSLVYYDSISKNRIYNRHMHANWVRFYQLFTIAVFYSFSFLFRPWRPFVSLRNVYTRKAESRSEDALLNFMARSRYRKNQTLATQEAA